MCCRTFTGAWIETLALRWLNLPCLVAPSRVRGLKPVRNTPFVLAFGRTFTGAWIETSLLHRVSIRWLRRTFTGAWIETLYAVIHHSWPLVAPSRVRGLKRLPAMIGLVNHACRTFTGAWIETILNDKGDILAICRTFTGAWIETRHETRTPSKIRVAPSRVRGLKHYKYFLLRISGKVAPSRVRGLKLQ